MTCTFICLLLNSFDLHRYSSNYKCTHLLDCYVDVSRTAEGKVFLFSCKRLGRSLWETIVASFLKFSTSSQNAEFHIHQSHMEIGLSEVIKFCTRKLIKKTHFMSPLKMINLFPDMMPNLSPKNVGLEVLRSAIFMINRTQLKPRNH